jgi:hypothetical protein
MGMVPPRIVQPDLELMWTVVGHTADEASRNRLIETLYRGGTTSMREAADTLAAASTVPWWGIWLDDGVSSERYGTSAYSTPEEAQAVCDALGKAYGRLCYTCQFSVRLRARELPAPRVNPQLIYKDY